MRVNDYDSSLAHYHCSSEWHLWQLKDRKGRRTPFAAVLYPFAFRMAKKSGRFFGSANRVAEHFGIDPSTVRRAMDALTSAGFFVVISQAYFQSTIYKVVSHEEWAKTHPEHCAIKAEFPWTDEEGDELGVRLYTVSGGRVKWFPNILTALRKTALTDDQIVQQFELFFAQDVNGGNGRYKSVPSRFLESLKEDRPKVKVREMELSPA